MTDLSYLTDNQGPEPPNKRAKQNSERAESPPNLSSTPHPPSPTIYLPPAKPPLTLQDLFSSTFTYRLQSYTSDETKLVLFRSDRPGSIAKIIYEKSMAESEDEEEEDAPKTEIDATSSSSSSSSTTTDTAVKQALHPRALSPLPPHHHHHHQNQAKVKCLEVKAAERSRGFGPLLVSSFLGMLQSNQEAEDEDDDDDDNDNIETEITNTNTNANTNTNTNANTNASANANANTNTNTSANANANTNANTNTNTNTNTDSIPLPQNENTPPPLPPSTIMTKKHHPNSTPYQITLDAEEDCARHNKLVSFYESLGFSVIPNAKITFVNHNDAEYFRKVPMVRSFGGSTMFTMPRSYSDGEENENGGGFNGAGKNNVKMPRLNSAVHKTYRPDQPHLSPFLPIRFLRNEKRATVSTAQDEDLLAPDDFDPSSPLSHQHKSSWFILQLNSTDFLFKSSNGMHLCVEPDGRVVSDRVVPERWERFRLLEEGIEDLGLNSNDDDDDDSPAATSTASSTSTSIPAPSTSASETQQIQKRYCLKTFHETYITIDSSNRLCTTRTPQPWSINPTDLSLRCTHSTRVLKRHFGMLWKVMCVRFYEDMRDVYGKFDLFKVKSLSCALDMLSATPFDPLSLHGNSTSLRTYAYTLAERARKAGKPEWFQFVCLVCGVGQVLRVVERGEGGCDVGGQKKYFSDYLCAGGGAGGLRSGSNSPVLSTDNSSPSSSPIPESGSEPLSSLPKATTGALPTYFDWTLECSSRVLGVRPPKNAKYYDEFYREDPDFGNYDTNDNDEQTIEILDNDDSINADNSDNNTATTTTGISDMKLTWSGAEYMSLMLKFNGATLPDEAYVLLRLMNLDSFYSSTTNGSLYYYDKLASPLEKESIEALKSFNELRMGTKRACGKECEDGVTTRLYEGYYKGLAKKFGLGGEVRF